jgi:hypothetical protein
MIFLLLSREHSECEIKIEMATECMQISLKNILLNTIPVVIHSYFLLLSLEHRAPLKVFILLHLLNLTHNRQVRLERDRPIVRPSNCKQSLIIKINIEIR